MTGILSSLNREQKEAVGLLQMGTFLEYFDLMLYVHMAVLLNELFFPRTDPHTASLIAAFTFCSTYVLRPFGALLFGYIGDSMRRKVAIIISTLIMAVSCFFMTIIPTYEQVGLLASVMMIFCRILQSLSATGEVIGAEIYLTESLDPPYSYQAVSWLAELCTLGGVAALFVTSVILECQAGWRSVFMLGGMIAFCGALARSRLRETSAFLTMKQEDEDQSLLPENERVATQTFWAYFFIYSGFPLCFYLVYIYGASILKNSMAYDIKQITHHNLLLTVLSFIVGFVLIMMAKRIHPLKILKVRAIIFGLFFVFIPFIPFNTNLYALYVVQVFLTVFCLSTTPAISIFFQHFPVKKRFTYSTVCFMP